ncbi:Hsp33 family molecular chaperone HslO [Croceicoccus esteveae]|uniref:Hsp33 family molecular chaperone HslO n=1 Tax=Croceicoccus esteveae TaxID=3075597 RepID=UPI003D789E23
MDNAGPAGETGFDQILAFSLPERAARGRFVRLGPVLDEVLGAHDYSPPVRHLLAEALVLTALMGALIKADQGQLTLQAQVAHNRSQDDEGAISLLVCDYRAGELRGYVRHDPEKLANHGSNIGLSDLFGHNAHLAITFDLASTDGDTAAERYQGIVPLSGDTLSQACEHYFRQSEQIPTLLRVAVQSDGRSTIAAGLLIQHVAEGEEGRERLHVRMDHPDWEHVATMGGSVRHAELVDPAISAEALIWRLFHEEDRILIDTGAALERGCRCTAEYYSQVLARFPASERADMREADGYIHVDCAFCSKLFRIDV